MRHHGDTNGHHLDPHTGSRGDGTTDTTIEAARHELAAAAAELEHLTDELRDRTQVVERLEVLADTLLDLLEVPAVVVDAQGRIAAFSRGALRARSELADALGKPASAVLGVGILDEIAAFAAGPRPTSQGSPSADGSARFSALPGGSTLVVFEP